MLDNREVPGEKHIASHVDAGVVLLVRLGQLKFVANFQKFHVSARGGVLVDFFLVEGTQLENGLAGAVADEDGAPVAADGAVDVFEIFVGFGE